MLICGHIPVFLPGIKSESDHSMAWHDPEPTNQTCKNTG